MTAIRQPFLPPSDRAETHRNAMPPCFIVRDRHFAADRHVYALRQSVRVARGAFAAHNVPGMLYRVFVLLVHLLTLRQSVLSAQFETATDFGSLLRANTPVSRMMTTYTRRGPGQTYLKSVLAERINSLIEHKELNLEINPSKVCSPSRCLSRYVMGRLKPVQVYEQMVDAVLDESGDLPPEMPRTISAEAAAEHPDVRNIIAPRITMLTEIANSFLLTIMDSRDSVPYGIRWICKQIRSLTRVRATAVDHRTRGSR